jgi:hypothetical protein
MKHIMRILAPVLLLSGQLMGQTLQHSEILGRPTDRSITVQTIFTDAAEVCIRYGTASGQLDQQTPWKTFAAGEPAEIVVDQLLPNMLYHYQVCHRVPGTGNVTYRPEYRFHTQRPPGAGFTFLIQADPHLDSQSDTALYRRCLLNQLADSADLMIDLGDIIMSDKMKNAQNQITLDTIIYRAKYMRGFYESACHSLPLFITLGNHEGESGWLLNGTPNNVAVYNTLQRKKYFLNPGPDGFYRGDETEHPFVGRRESYYSWTWGDAHFIVLDPYFHTSPKPDSLTGWRWTLGKTQYDWLRNELETSQSTFKFVFVHQLVGGDPQGRGGIEYADRYEWGGANLDGSEGWSANRPGWYKPIKDLLTENRVTAFFHGHDHFFAKQDKDCLVYQLCPQPSLPNFTGVNQATDYGYQMGQILPNSGHLRVQVGPEAVKVEYVRAFLPTQETATRKNRDVAAMYSIGAKNCYDSLSTSTPVVWNEHYSELIYPNPSAGDVLIRFSLAHPEPIDLSILDLNGRPVRRLLSAELIPSGDFQISWDGRDNSGQRLPAGTYFYSISGKGGNRSTGQIMLVE